MTLSKKYIAGIVAVVLAAAYSFKRRYGSNTEIEEFSATDDQSPASS
jgi:hypothetical protein